VSGAAPPGVDRPPDAASRLAPALLVTGVALVAFMGAWPLQDPDEGRYTVIARAMATSGDWFCSRLNGLRYQEKPPFFFWLVAACLKTFGTSEFAARIPSTLASILTLVLTGRFAAKRLGARAAAPAVLLLATLPLCALLFRFVLVDLTLMLFVTAAVVLAHEAMRVGEASAPLRRGPYLGAWACAAAACLIKGPIGLALPLAGIVPFLLLERRWAQLLQWLRPDGLLLFAAIVVPPYWLVERANPGFLHEFLVAQNFGRLTGNTDFGRDHPFWFYVPVFAAAFLPGSLRVVDVARSCFTTDVDGRRSTRRLLACAVAGPFLLLSSAHSMLVYYLLPLAPPFALLCADSLLRAEDDARERRAPRRAAAVAYASVGGLFALLAVVALATPWAWSAEQLLAALPDALARRRDPVELALRVATIHATLPWFASVSAPVAAGLFVAAWRARRGEPLHAGIAVARGVLVLVLLAPFVLRGADRLISSGPVAALITEHQRPGEPLFQFDVHLRGLPFYLGRNSTLWTATYSEFGHALPLQETWPDDAPPLALQKDRAALERFFSGNTSLLVLLSGEDHLAELHASKAMRFRELTRDGNLILLRGERN
jgi:4-amino-4-deoxy-L-arabinose transferase-like glycosyltransferase